MYFFSFKLEVKLLTHITSSFLGLILQLLYDTLNKD